MPGGNRNKGYINYDDGDVITEIYKNGTYIGTNVASDRRYAVNQWQIWGVDIPKYHAKRRRGDLLPHTYFERFSQNGMIVFQAHDEYYASGSNTYRYLLTEGKGYAHNDWDPTYRYVVDTYLPYLNDKFITDAVAKIYGEGHDSLTFLTELPKVRNLFISTAKDLLRIFTNPKVLLQIKKYSASWLSARYGWRTLLYDLEDLGKILERICKEEEKRTRYTDRAGTTFSVTDTDTSTNVPYVGREDTTVLTHEAEVGVRGSVTMDYLPPDFQFNLLQTGWELIPFSFIVDWFIGIGSALSTMAVLQAQPNHSASAGLSVKLHTEYFQYATFTNPRSGISSSTAYCDTEYLLRSPRKIPYSPPIRVNMNTAKVVDLLSLLIQRR